MKIKKTAMLVLFLLCILMISATSATTPTNANTINSDTTNDVTHNIDNTANIEKTSQTNTNTLSKIDETKQTNNNGETRDNKVSVTTNHIPNPNEKTNNKLESNIETTNDLTNQKLNEKFEEKEKKESLETNSANVISKSKNNLLTSNGVKVTVNQIGNKYKNTKINAKFTYEDGSAFANSQVRLTIGAESWIRETSVTLTTDENGEINYNVLRDPHTYEVNFYVYQNNQWSDKIATKTIKIEYVYAKIIAPSKISNYYKSNKKIAVKVVDEHNKPLKNVKVTMDPNFDFSKTLTTNSKGYVYFKINNLDMLNKLAIFDLGYDTIYSAKAVRTKLKIKKIPVKIFIKRAYFKDKGKKVGYSLSFGIKHKYTKKYLPAVFKVTIDAGKYYKTIYLSSSKKTKYLAGLVTNGFSKGTHKVTISVYSDYYYNDFYSKSSAKTKLKIPAYSKKLKNYYILVSGGKIKMKYKL